MSFDEDAKERVRQAVDIVDLIGGYYPLRRQGRHFVALCPWHEDSRPSLQVNPDRQSWKCWVCNIGGDVFSFVMQREGIDFREALELLADRAGIVLPQHAPPTRRQAGSLHDKKALFEACVWAERQFRDCLQKSAEAEVARRYYASRGIAASSEASFRLGFSPNRWQWLVDRAAAAPLSLPTLEAAGIVGRNPTGGYYDRFKGRVIFPIHDAQGRTIAFGGRVLPEFADDKSAKYVNSPETRLFSKSEHVYGLDLAREGIAKSGNVVVVEGYTDVIMAHQFGLTNVVAVLGTALGERHIRLLRRYADTITLVLDGDDAGQRRTNEVLELFVAGEVDVRILTLPEGLDPCDFLLQHGAEAMQSLLKGAVDAFEHAVEQHTRGVDLQRDTHRAHQALEQLLGTIAKAPRLTAATSTSRLLRERQVLARLAREFRLDESVLRTRISELRRSTPAPKSVAAELRGKRWTPGDVDPCDAELLELLSQHADLADAALAEVGVDELASEPARVIYAKYQFLAEQGEPLDFQRVLSALDDVGLKSLFVSLDERASDKERHAQSDGASRLRRLIAQIHLRHEEHQRREALATLEQGKCADEEAMDLFQQVLEQERKRQGISAPTDG